MKSRKTLSVVLIALPIAVIVVGLIIALASGLIKDYREGGQLLMLSWPVFIAGCASVPLSIAALIINRKMGAKWITALAVAELILASVFVIFTFVPFVRWLGSLA